MKKDSASEIQEMIAKLQAEKEKLLGETKTKEAEQKKAAENLSNQKMIQLLC